MMTKFFALALLLVSCVAVHAQTLWYTDSVANLAGNATFTGTTRDSGASSPPYSFFGCSFNTDQAGTAFIDDSTDGTTWAVAATAAIVANTRLDLNVRLRVRYIRCRETNGATPQTTNRVVSSFTGS